MATEICHVVWCLMLLKYECWNVASQEYFVRHKDGYTLNTESERHKLTLCLIAAIERRISQVCQFIQPLDLMNLTIKKCHLSSVTRLNCE